MDSRLAAGVALGAAGMWVLQCGRGPAAAAKPPAPGHDLRHTRPLPAPAPAPAASTPAAEVKDPTIVALLPMKHTSVRVPGKNYRTLGDKPLCSWILSTLCKCKRISKVVVDTDSPLVKELLERDFPEVMVIDRPPHLLNDPPMNEILLYDTSVVEADFYFQTHVTNPFLKLETIDAALESFLSKYPYENDSLFSVRQWQTRLYDQLGTAVNHNPNMLLRTQDLPPIYEENSCMYLFTRECLATRQHRIGTRPLMHVMADLESTDIDTEHDFSMAEVLAGIVAGNQ